MFTAPGASRPASGALRDYAGEARDAAQFGGAPDAGMIAQNQQRAGLAGLSNQASGDQSIKSRYHPQNRADYGPGGSLTETPAWVNPYATHNAQTALKQLANNSVVSKKKPTRPPAQTYRI